MSKTEITNSHAMEGMLGYYFVYRATNKLNNKSYIGITKDFQYRHYRHFLDTGNGSQLHFHRALRKYGEDAFEWTILYRCSDEHSASIIEQQCVKFYDSYTNGYNMTTGGQRGWKKVTAEETKRKLSALYKGKSFEERHGTERAAEIKHKQSSAHKGKQVSQDTRKRMSEANKRRWKEGTIGRKGKPCTVNGKQYENGKEAADCLGIASSTLRNWIKQGKNGARYL